MNMWPTCVCVCECVQGWGGGVWSCQGADKKARWYRVPGISRAGIGVLANWSHASVLRRLFWGSGGAGVLPCGPED